MKIVATSLEVIPVSGKAVRQALHSYVPDKTYAGMSESLHIVCPHCQGTNGVRADQLASAPDCGQCKQPLFTGKPVDLAEAAFDKHLQRNQIPLLVDFWAPC